MIGGLYHSSVVVSQNSSDDPTRAWPTLAYSQTPYSLPTTLQQASRGSAGKRGLIAGPLFCVIRASGRSDFHASSLNTTYQKNTTSHFSTFSPLTSHQPPKMASLLALAQTDVTDPIPTTSLLSALSNPPFIHLPDTFNTRDLGLVPGSPIRPNLVYRSGGFLTGLTAAGRAALSGGTIDVKKVVDLRSVRERERLPDPEVEGVEMVWVQPGEEDAVVGLEEFVEGEGEKGYVGMYLDVLRVYQGGIRAVLEGVRDGRGEEALLFHCTGELSFFSFFFYREEKSGLADRKQLGGTGRASWPGCCSRSPERAPRRWHWIFFCRVSAPSPRGSS